MLMHVVRDVKVLVHVVRDGWILMDVVRDGVFVHGARGSHILNIWKLIRQR